jgi:hypothetical protein
MAKKKAAKAAGTKKAVKKPAKTVARKKHPGRTGRPLKFAGQRLHHSVPIALSDQQLELLDKAVRITGRKRSDLLRDAALERARQIVEQAKRKGG